MDNDIFSENLRAAEERRPYLLDEIRKEPDFENYAVEVCTNGEKTIKARHKGGYIYLHSKYDPTNVGLGIAEYTSREADAIFVVHGMGFGYEINGLLQGMGEYNRLVICEPDFGILCHAFRNVDLTRLMRDDRVLLFVGKTKDETNALLRGIFTPETVDDMVFIQMPVYERLFGEHAADLRKVARDVVIYNRAYRNTIVDLGERWFRGHFKNWITMANSCPIDNFFGILEGKPAVLVSAGPSLNKNIDLLDGIKGKVFIICVYTALKVLEKRNIRPDMVISLDAKQIIYKEFTNYGFDMPLIFLNTINPEMFETHSGKTVIATCSNDVFITEILAESGVATEPVEAGESVACAALDILCKMGADPIIFIGQDFAYSEGKNHAEGTFYDGKNSVDDVESDKFYVDAWDGGQVLTDSMWYLYLEWFRRYIAERKNERVFIDATEGGALIEGTERLTFREAIGKFCAEGCCVDEMLESCFAKGNLLNAERLRNLIARLKKTRDDLAVCVEPLKEGITLSEKLTRLYKHTDMPNPKDVSRTLEKFKKVDAALDKAKDSTPVMDMLFSHASLKSSPIRRAEMSEGAYVALRSETLYRNLLEVTEKTLPLIDEAVRDLSELL